MTDVVAVEVLAPRGDLVTAAPVDDVVALQRQYVKLCSALLDATDIHRIRDDKGNWREYKKRSAWRKLAVAFNVSAETVEYDETRDDDGAIVRARYTVRALAPNGRHMDGVGVCDIGERRFKSNKDRAEHDLPATAYTRAANRAFADLFGLGEVSAEEIDTTQAEFDQRVAAVVANPPCEDDNAPTPGREMTNTRTTGADASEKSRTRDASAAIIERLEALTPEQRQEFDYHVVQMRWPWPPTSGAVIRAADRFIDQLEADR